MKKSKLKEAVSVTKSDTKEALQTVIDALNKGQKKKLYGIDAIKTLLDRYGVIIE